MSSESLKIRRVQYHKYGVGAEMRLEELMLPAPSGYEVRVLVKAGAINEIDWKLKEGYMKILTGWNFPNGMGIDFSGIVESVGEKVTKFKKGDEVVGGTPIKKSGSFGEAVISVESQIVLKPKNLSFQEACVLPAVGATAWRSLHHYGKIKSGAKIFLNGAMGGLGLSAFYIAKLYGATVVGRVGPSDMDEAKKIGFDGVLNYKDSLPTNLFGTFDIVFDCHGSLAVDDGNRLTKQDGVVLDSNPNWPKRFWALIHPKRKMVFGTQGSETLQKIVDLADQKKLKVRIGEVVNLNGAIPLIKKLEAGESFKGKCVIEI